MSNLKKRVRQRNENVLIRDIKNSKCVNKGESYRTPLWWAKERCPITDNGKEGVRDYDTLCAKFYKATGAKLEVYSKNKGIKDLPVDKINKTIEKRLLKEKPSSPQIQVVTPPAIINNTTTIVDRKGISTEALVISVLSSAIVGGIIGYCIRKHREKKNTKKKEGK